MKEVTAGRFTVHCESGAFPTYFVDKKTGTYTDFATGRYGSTDKAETNVEPEGKDKRIIRVLNAAGQIFKDNRKVVSSYCKKRNLSDSDQERFGIGASTEIIAKMKSLGYTEEELLRAGLIKKREDGTVTELFWNRLMFPIRDKDGDIVGFGGRVTDAKAKSCKYLNTPETELFQKRSILYMYDIASKAECNSYILCEGYMDVISMHKAGFINTVASMGTSLTPEQIELLKTKPHIYCMFDSDEAGVKAAKRNVPALLKEGFLVKVVNLSPCKDPDELLSQEEGKNILMERLKEAKPGKEFLRETYKAGDSQEIVDVILNY